VPPSHPHRHQGRCLALARQRAGISQDAAAKAIDVRKATLSGWETGSREPKASELQALADLYDVTLDELTGRAPLPPPRKE
jgi:transcriptional regulator with XRE-family HTH domain